MVRLFLFESNVVLAFSFGLLVLVLVIFYCFINSYSYSESFSKKCQVVECFIVSSDAIFSFHFSVYFVLELQ